MQSGFGEVSRGQGAAFPVDEVLTSDALHDQLTLQRPRVHRELVGDCLDAALAGGQ